MKKLEFLIASMLFSSVLYAQSPIKISWTGELNCEYYQLDSVWITNKATWEKKVFYYPDTVLMYNNLDITPPRSDAETKLKTFPNPFSSKVLAEFSLAHSGEVDISVCDMLGREVICQRYLLERGTQRFDLSLPQGIYTLNLQTADGKQSVRMLSESSANITPQIVHVATVPTTAEPLKKVQKYDGNDFSFSIGDILQFECYITASGNVIVSEYEKRVEDDFFHTFTYFDSTSLKQQYSVEDLNERSREDYPEKHFSGAWGEQNTIIIINDQETLDCLLAKDQKETPLVDFNKYTVLFVHGFFYNPPVETHSIFGRNNANTLAPLGNYVLKVDIIYGAQAIPGTWSVLIAVDKIPDNAEVCFLPFYYSIFEYDLND